ncbi:universal stress protein [Streptomyces yaizuensis]|uniref:Universal stress protein n=1 Tax=Streptomyces yaizuensis TaxID=2989713 RepID=A0ABQ5NRB4_9ACTN|nr:universal stress protein [Streptomyces sp. YSPA8]GLF92928.1 universal stress protein [Streptomyces sp. YSPA8]
MAVVVWIVEGTWTACVDAARAQAPRDGRTVLLHVTSPDPAAVARGAYASLLGRAHLGRDPADRLEHLAAASAGDLLARAAERLARPSTRVTRTGRAEHEVVAAAGDAELLVCARDGDRADPGPRSLGPATRFVVDHALCPVLLVWPGPPVPPSRGS